MCFDFPSYIGFVLIYCLGTVFVSFRFADLLGSKFSADLMTLASSTSQIRRHDYSIHFNFVIPIVCLEIELFYVINSDDVSLFAYSSSFLVFSEFEYVMILIDVLYWFE
jgi:hypothetical protein